MLKVIEVLGVRIWEEHDEKEGKSSCRAVPLFVEYHKTFSSCFFA